ncbi:S-adenosyl-L-methionine-dependent methyltransferase [Lyophyllum atratum]|nr:S-adenosyl-L-methionine-dependent methyltransferase [Lyophyllum atratum]
MARRRPNAFEVSFLGEANDIPSDLTSLRPTDSSPTPRATSLKRKSEAHSPDDSRESKRLQLPPPAFYKNRDEEELEDAELVLEGEDPFAGEDEDDDAGQGEPDKPIRVLFDFTIYDPKHHNEMMSLNAIEEDDGVDRQFEGAGYAFPYVVNEEDEGQEDELLEDGDGAKTKLKYIRLGAILRYTFDPTQPNDPVYIETQFAWYILRTPHPAYEPYFQHFFTPRRIAQMVISTALKHPRKSYEEFLQRFVATVDVFGRTYKEEHLWGAVPELQDAVEDCEDSQKLKATPLVQHILRKASSSSQPRPARRKGASRNRRAPPIKALLGSNIDAAVLKAENQIPTHVTPFIASLAQGLVYEELVVVGVRPPPPNMAQKEAQKEAAHARLCELVELALKQHRKRVDIPIEHRVKIGNTLSATWITAAEVDGVLYKKGDFVLVPIQYRTKNNMYLPPTYFPDNIRDIDPTSTIADYFWFAKILHGSIDMGRFHVQWLQHSSQTMMEELGHSQELFFNDLCDYIPFSAVIGKVVVHEDPSPPLKADEYFVKFTYDINQAAYTSFDFERRKMAMHNPPPDNCMVCPLIGQRDQEKFDNPLKDDQGIVNGVAYGGHQYHYEDFVLYRAQSGPAHIGYITGFDFRPMKGSEVTTQVYIQRVGRISAIPDSILPPDYFKDERHVFLTEEQATVPLKDLLRVCYVFPFESIDIPKQWLALSPLHFYIKYTFPSMSIRSWAQRKPMPCTELGVCKPHITQKIDELKKTRQFYADAQQRPSRLLDLFGGVGLFSKGLEEGSGCLELTDLVEISPSAAKTVMWVELLRRFVLRVTNYGFENRRRNFPNVAVHNQCVNEILRYSIKEKSGQQPEAPKQLYDGKTSVPKLKKPDVITAGVPCQTHSRMNMYKKAGDTKSNLILTALSFVDHLRPSLFYFENVPGFQKFTFDATQAGIHRVEGGMPMGGLKFVVRALVEMRYQVRFGLLQAGHYGTPQRRHRFFLVAAIDGHPLPELPEPSHDFPDISGLTIKLPIGNDVRPFRTMNGTAPHRHVTIDEAISDLPRFDWSYPKPYRQSQAKQSDMRIRGQTIRAVKCEVSKANCGFSGPDVGYHHAPKTTFQEAARVKPTKDLQHFTRTFAWKKVERVVSIPLKANADYRDLRPDQQEWQVANPLSSVARKNYRKGLYGRLDQNFVFPTIVTNMDTTAKQSTVLNPYCHRMVTVRELARSQGFPDHFVFEAIGNSVVTMHRQIGNAVPLPIGIALGRELRLARFKKWETSGPDVILIDSDSD